MGSLRWLEAAASKRWSRVKLNQLWLLLLRCAILLLLAVALAQPVWVQQEQKVAGRKAVYIGEELLYSSSLKPLVPSINSLLRQGYTLHTYTPDFKEISTEQWKKLSDSPLDSIVRTNSNYWSLLAALAEKHKYQQDSAWLFTSDQQRFFRGARPASMLGNVRWVPLASEASADWLQLAVQSAPDSLLLFLGNSTREGSTYTHHRTAASARSVSLRTGVMQLQKRGDTLQAMVGPYISKVKIQKKPLQVSLLANEAQQEEVKHLQAALGAISSYTGLPVQVTTQPDSLADWVFWLQEEMVPESLMQRVAQEGTTLWLQPGATPIATQTRMATPTGATARIHLLNSLPAPGEEARTIWAGMNSDPLLSVRPYGKGNVYQFRSGFSPTWSELGQSPQLPELLLPLLFAQPEVGFHDLRALDEQQLLPSRRTTLAAPATPAAKRQHLLPWFVLAAFVLFLTERINAGRRSKE